MAKRISKAKQMKIAKYYLKNPGSSYDKVGIKFKVSRDQVRNYVKKFRNEQYISTMDKQTDKEIAEERQQVTKELNELGAATLMNEVIIDVIAELRIRKDLSIEERLNMINKMTLAQHRTQKLQFVEALRKPDAKRVIELCKTIDPNITENRIIELWKKIELER